MRDGNRLIGSPETVLTIAPLLLKHGLENEARQLFDLAEPLDLLSGVKFIGCGYGHRRQFYFRSIEQIITAIQQVALETDALDSDEETANERILDLKNSLLFQAGLALLEITRWDDLLEIEKVLSSSGANGQHWWFQLRVRTWSNGIADGEIDKAKLIIEDRLRISIRPI